MLVLSVSHKLFIDTGLKFLINTCIKIVDKKELKTIRLSLEQAVGRKGCMR
jgi:hypothetical protein